MATFSFEVLEFNSSQIGIELAAGKIFQNIDEYLFKTKSGELYNISLFYSLSKRSTLKFQLEKQVDRMISTLYPPDFILETFEYNLNRIAIGLMYIYQLSKD